MSSVFALLTAVLSVVGLVVFESLVYPIGYLAYWRQVGSTLSITASLGLVIIYVWGSLRSSMSARIGYWCIFTGVIALEYAYLNVMGAFLGLADVDLIVAAPNYWAGAIRLFWDWKALIPAGGYALLLAFTPVPSKPRGPLMLAASLGLLVGFHAAIYPFSLGRFPTPALSAFFRTTTSAVLTQVVVPAYRSFAGRAQSTREAVRFRASAAPQRNIVLIIDESVRADHLGINGYTRATTPGMREALARTYAYNWGVASAAATLSTASNRLMLTGVNEIPDHGHQTDRWPTILQFARAMGYRTTLVNGQTVHSWNLDPGDLQYIDAIRTIESFGWDLSTDDRIARWLVAWLPNRRGEFVLINKRGVHFPYEEAYPPDQATWTPVMQPFSRPWGSAYGPNGREEIVNSYDNALRYNVDRFFEVLFRDSGTLSNSYVMYTSDHGESLHELGDLRPHGGSSVGEAVVPLVLISPRPLVVDTGFRASHFNVMATLLDLMMFPETERTHPYAMSLLRAKATDYEVRRFLYGDLYGRTSEPGGVAAFDRR